MNMMDLRVIGASALTAAAVSLLVVTVIDRRHECPPPAPVAPILVTQPAPAVAVAPAHVDPAAETKAAYEDLAKANCDAEALKDKAMENINMGQHAAALQSLEASLACHDDTYVRQLAFMESCASGNSPKAKKYYLTLTPAQQTKFAQICIRQKPSVDYQ